jgi:phage head maturation protease
VEYPAYPDSQVAARSADPYTSYLEEKKAKEDGELPQKLILQTYL